MLLALLWHITGTAVKIGLSLDSKLVNLKHRMSVSVQLLKIKYSEPKKNCILNYFYNVYINMESSNMIYKK